MASDDKEWWVDRELIRDVLDRLEANPPTGEKAPTLVRTALLGGGDDLRAVLDGHDPGLQPPPAAASPDA